MKIANTRFSSNANYIFPAEDIETLEDPKSVSLFDQNGYHLTKAEQAFLIPNGYNPIERRHEDVLRRDWLIWDKYEKAHINHSDLFERKGFQASALTQLKEVAKGNPMLYKLIHMKPKWGIDISIDYVSEEGVFEVFHYEWDSFEYQPAVEKKEEIEEFTVKQDWDDIANVLWKKRDEWYYLDFFEQSKWRTDFFGLSPGKFKNVIWDN